MGYSTQTLVTRVLAQALTSKTPDTLDTLGDLMNIGNTLDSNNVTTAVVNTYISDADADINATIGMMYAVPLNKKADMETTLTSVASAAQRAIVVPRGRSEILVPGDTLVITDGDNREDVEVYTVSGTTVTLTADLVFSYSSSNTRVVRIKYADPIPYISSRIAAGNIYDKFFAAQADKNESNYGKYLRGLAYKKLQNILQGIAVLNGCLRTGHLTLNGNTIKQYKIDNANELIKLDEPGGR